MSSSILVRRRAPRVRRIVLAAVGALTVGVVAAPPASAADFYTPPADASGAPGTVVRSEPSEFYLDPLKVLKAPADVTRVMYRSANADGPTTVTGTVLQPRTPWRGAGERPVVAYAVGTQGMADRCAPSRQLAAGTEYEGAFIKGLLARGYTVTVTDYEGLGTPGVHPYVDPRALGRNVLDSVRAAQRLGVVTSTAPVLLSGYSEGGNAAAGALELASTYAPELRLKGGYAGAVPADLARVAPKLDRSPYAAFLGYAVAALDDAEPQLRIRDLLNDRGRQFLDRVQDSCLIDGVAAFAFTDTSTLTVDGRPVASFLSRPDIAAALAERRLGEVRPTVPALVVHSGLDDVVDYAQGRDMARSWCGQGAKVRFQTLLTPTHVGGAVAGFPNAFAFLEGRVAGLPFVSTCGTF
jgi:alpha-beta hydrolase superfamily lysophospholipase